MNHIFSFLKKEYFKLPRRQKGDLSFVEELLFNGFADRIVIVNEKCSLLSAYEKIIKI